MNNLGKSRFDQGVPSTSTYSHARSENESPHASFKANQKPKQPTAYFCYFDQGSSAKNFTHAFMNGMFGANYRHSADARNVNASALLDHLIGKMVNKMSGAYSGELNFIQRYLHYFIAVLEQLDTSQTNNTSSSFTDSADAHARAHANTGERPRANAKAHANAGPSTHESEQMTPEQARKELCEFLGLPVQVSDKELHTAYRKQSLQYHPDKAKARDDSPDKIKENEEKFKRLGYLNTEWQRGLTTDAQ